MLIKIIIYYKFFIDLVLYLYINKRLPLFFMFAWHHDDEMRKTPKMLTMLKWVIILFVIG
jgi:hypothetical protein